MLKCVELRLAALNCWRDVRAKLAQNSRLRRGPQAVVKEDSDGFFSEQW